MYRRFAPRTPLRVTIRRCIDGRAPQASTIKGAWKGRRAHRTQPVGTPSIGTWLTAAWRLAGKTSTRNAAVARPPGRWKRRGPMSPSASTSSMAPVIATSSARKGTTSGRCCVGTRIDEVPDTGDGHHDRQTDANDGSKVPHSHRLAAVQLDCRRCATLDASRRRLRPRDPPLRSRGAGAVRNRVSVAARVVVDH